MATLITTNDVREICLNKATFDVAKFQPFLKPAEITFLKPFLGRDLYNELVAESDSTFSEANEELFKYLKPALAWKTLELALPSMHTDITSSGLKLNNSEFANSGTDKSRADLITNAKQIAEAFLEDAKEFIEDEDNIDTYPLYEKDGNVSNDINLIGGMILDDND